MVFGVMIEFFKIVCFSLVLFYQYLGFRNLLVGLNVGSAGRFIGIVLSSILYFAIFIYYRLIGAISSFRLL